MDCKHPHLTRIVNIENGGQDSKTYQCQECKALVIVESHPLEIGVHFGTK